MNKLVIAEKPSVSKSLAAVLGANTRRDGYFEGGGYLVSWCYGHLVELAHPAAYGEQYKRWAYDTLPIQLHQFRSLQSFGSLICDLPCCSLGCKGSQCGKSRNNGAIGYLCKMIFI